MTRSRTWLLLSALLALSACDRLAGTEVGNPEITVAAKFGITPGDSSVIPEMDLKVMGMGWNVGSDSGYCWNDPAGHMMAFSSDSETPLPTVTLKDGDWSKVEMMLQATDSAAVLPDNAAFSEWSNPRYIKLVKIMDGDTVRALFELPSGLAIRLGFGKTAIKSWRTDHHMTVLIVFNGGKWAGGLEHGPFTYRMDGRQQRYILLAPGENAAAYEALKALLPGSFQADTSEMLGKTSAARGD